MDEEKKEIWDVSLTTTTTDSGIWFVRCMFCGKWVKLVPEKICCPYCGSRLPVVFRKEDGNI